MPPRSGLPWSGAGTLLQVGMVLRYELAHRLLREQVAAGAFGDLVSIRCQRNCSRSSFAAIADRVHTVFRTLIHDIDLLLWLSGSRVQSVTALEFRQGDHLAPLGCFALLQLASGCIAQLEGRVHGALQEQLQDFLAAVRLGRPSPIANLADAVQGLRVAEAIIDSARRGITITLTPMSAR